MPFDQKARSQLVQQLLHMLSALNTRQPVDVPGVQRLAWLDM